MRVLVDRDSCCASGQCVVAVPDVFDQSDDDGRVVLLDDRPPAALYAAVREAVLRCPGRAITAQED